MKRPRAPEIALVGPESTGKTTLARLLARRFGATWVPEHARSYLQRRGGVYDAADLPHIAHGQLTAERRARARKGRGRLLVLDTDLVVLHVWSLVRFQHVDALIGRKLARVGHRRYLLMAPDLAWEADPLRENPHDRDLLFERYRATLERFGYRYAVIRGTGLARLVAAERALARLARRPRRHRRVRRRRSLRARQQRSD